MADAALPAEIAYYYPEPYWLADEGSWIKSLLLFFDEIAILLPSYMYGRHLVADPTLAEPLEDRGLLRVLEPASFVDAEMAAQLADVMLALLAEGAFDDLDDAGRRAELSMSRMGHSVSHEIFEEMLQAFEARGLATRTQDGVSIPLHHLVRGAYLVVLAQLARETGARRELDLHPVTNGRGATEAFRALMELGPMPSRGHVVAFDLEVVGVDLTTVPLDEVLEFRRENQGAHRRYMQHLRQFALELSLLEDADRARALADRRSDLRDEARDLRERARASWRDTKDVAGFGLGIAGAAWSLATMNPVPAVLGALGAGLNMLPSKASGSAYSYLFEARRALP